MLPILAFHPTFPEALKPETRELLTPLLALLGDLESLQLKVTSTADEDVPVSDAAIKVVRRYHTAHVYLDSTFFALAPEEKRQILLHELMHVRMNAFSREVQHVMHAWVPEEVFGYVSARLDDAEEEVTDALAHAVDRLLTHATRDLTFKDHPDGGDAT